MFNVVLVEPEIPPNTGNIIRLCANTGAALHLVGPLGFPLNDARMRRAGLDYHEFATLRLHVGWQQFVSREQPDEEHLFAFTVQGPAPLASARFPHGAWLVFGSETRGLGDALLSRFSPQRRVRLPMRPTVRSLNLSNAVAIAVYEAWRQLDYAGSC